jgi:hypothetical protein
MKLDIDVMVLYDVEISFCSQETDEGQNHG